MATYKLKKKKLKTIAGWGQAKPKSATKLMGDWDKPSSKTSDAELRANEIQRRIGGSYSEAKRIASLEQRMPAGTLPELVTYDWLKRNNVHFGFQVEINGGRARSGGQVPDFVVYKGGGAAAWLIQGDYFHGSRFQAQHGQQGRDLTAELRLIGSYAGGVRIESVIQLFEKDILTRRPSIFVYAMSGVSLVSA